MAISYSENNKRTNTFEPLVSRVRLPYKGPVRSSIFNLFNDQFLMDIHRLNNKTSELETLITTLSDMSRNDLNQATPDYYLNQDLLMTVYSQEISYNLVSQEYEVSMATPYYNDSLSFDKAQKNASTISFLNRKLDLIEEALRKEQ
jgi:hypothetical protein